MKIAIIGLGKMGGQIVRKLAEGGHSVVAFDFNADFVKEAVSHGAVATDGKQGVVDAFAGERVVVWLMIPADFVDKDLAEWQTVLPKDSIVIDGGNSNFNLTAKRNETMKAAGLHLVDVGTSGGVWGYQNGFSMMVGCDDPAVFSAIEPVLKTLAQPEGAYHRFGPSGSGHYVKMVHNAIEYGMMQSLGEGYRMLKEGPYQNLDLAEAGEIWQHHSVITSWLNELTRDALRENPEMEGIDGVVAESGECRWTLEEAAARNIKLPAIQASFDVRVASQKGETNFATKIVAAQRNKFGGHNLNVK